MTISKARGLRSRLCRGTVAVAASTAYRKNGHGHIVLFGGWANSAHTAIKAYEEKGTAHGTVATVRYVSTLKANGYHPIRYGHIA